MVFMGLSQMYLQILRIFYFIRNHFLWDARSKKNKNKLILLTIFNAVDSSDEYHFCKENRKSEDEFMKFRAFMIWIHTKHSRNPADFWSKFFRGSAMYNALKKQKNDNNNNITVTYSKPNHVNFWPFVFVISTCFIIMRALPMNKIVACQRKKME